MDCNRSGEDITPFTNLDRKQTSAYFRLSARESKLKDACIELMDIDSDGLLVEFIRNIFNNTLP
jgi:hypothetical protein